MITLSQVVQAISNPLLTKVEVGQIHGGSQNFPLSAYTTWKQRPTKPVIVITAGIHGDEPAGIKAAVDFAQHELDTYTSRFDFLIIPLLNPWGLVNNKRRNKSGVDLNRAFMDTVDTAVEPEVQAWTKYLQQLQITPVLSLDLHEDITDCVDELGTPPPYFYLYESNKVGAVTYGLRLVEKIKEHCEVCSWDTIYGDKVIQGCILSGEQQGSVEKYLFNLGCNFSFTFETPTCWDFTTRVKIQILAIKEAIGLL